MKVADVIGSLEILKQERSLKRLLVSITIATLFSIPVVGSDEAGLDIKFCHFKTPEFLKCANMKSYLMVSFMVQNNGKAGEITIEKRLHPQMELIPVDEIQACVDQWNLPALTPGTRVHVLWRWEEIGGWKYMQVFPENYPPLKISTAGKCIDWVDKVNQLTATIEKSKSSNAELRGKVDVLLNDFVQFAHEKTCGVWGYDKEDGRYRLIEPMENATAGSIVTRLNALHPDPGLELLKIEGDIAFVRVPDAEYLTQRMGTTGAEYFMALVTISLTSLSGIEHVNFSFKEGDHAIPGAYSRVDFIDFWLDEVDDAK